MKKLVLIIFLGANFAGCNKKYKEPTEVEFHMDINKAPSVSGMLTFSDGYFIMKRLDFDGDREKGEDVSFTRNYDTGLQIPFGLSTNIEDLNFSIPQGVYKSVELAFDTYVGSSPCIVVNAVYQYSGGGTIPVLFEFDDSEEFAISAESEDGSLIVLDAEIASQAKIVLDPSHWFQPIPTTYFESATLTNIGGANTIVINKNTNEDIYDLILDRIDESTEAIFNY